MSKPKKLSPPDALKRLNVIAETSGDDPEAAHSEADYVLCALLRWYGREDVVQAFLDVEKWYA